MKVDFDIYYRLLYLLLVILITLTSITGNKDYALPSAASDANYTPPFITSDKGYILPSAANNANYTYIYYW